MDTLQRHITDLNTKNTTIQRWVIVLAVAALISTLVQTAVAIRAEVRAGSQSESTGLPREQPVAPAVRPSQAEPPTSNQPAAPKR